MLWGRHPVAALEFMEGEAKEYRDKLEANYIANMDFKAINDFVEQN